MIIEKLYEYRLRNYLKYREKERNGYIHVTRLVLCPLRKVYEDKYPEVTKHLILDPILNIGSILHEGLQKLLKEWYSNVLIEYEVIKEFKVNEEKFKIIGTLDAYLPDQKIVIEIKTARSDLGIPHEHHVKQLKIYMNLVDASRGVLIYLTPERVTEYEYSDKASDEEVIQLIRNYINLEKTPLWDWECKYCSFRVICNKVVSSK